MSNIVRAYLGGGTFCRTAPLYQYDYGQILILEGVKLPQAYEAQMEPEFVDVIDGTLVLGKTTAYKFAF